MYIFVCMLILGLVTVHAHFCQYVCRIISAFKTIDFLIHVGYTILHQVVELHMQSFSITTCKFLLSQKESQSMLVTSWKGDVTPFDIAKKRMVSTLYFTYNTVLCCG